MTPRFVLDFNATEDVLLYGSATRGFRSGGWNYTEPTIPGIDNGFGEEDVWSYEIGAKTQLADGALTLNVAAFHADYSDLQLRSTNELALLEVRNAADATIQGLELEFQARPTDRFNIAGTVSYLDATYGSFEFGSILNPAVLLDGDGNRLNRAPEWQASITADYEMDLANVGTLTPRVEWQYNGELFHSPDNVQPFGSEAFNIVNLRLRFDSNQNWGVEGFLENAGDERYNEHTFQGILPTIQPAVVSRPQTWGLRAFSRF